MALTREEILDGLNPQQEQVATFVDGKALVLAGAGSGKTHTLTRRIAYLLYLGIPAYQITAISFTKKAANEIKERVEGMMGGQALDVQMGTFHKICIQILFRNQQRLYNNDLLGQPQISVLDDSGSTKKMKDICLECGVMDEDKQALILNRIGFWSSNGIMPHDVDLSIYDEDFVNVYQAYKNYKFNLGYVDYDDMLLLTLNLLKKDDSVLEEVSSKMRYLLIDECQDLNNVQFQLMQYMTSHWGNFMIIGDDLQSLYAFRGANVNNMMDIRQIDPEIQTFLLEKNYRSTQTIVEASNAMIATNKHQLEKVAYSNRGVGNPIFAYGAQDETKEADYLVEIIQGLVGRSGYQYDDIAIIYRAAWVSRQIEFAFNAVGIPYEVKNGTSFYEKKEIKDISSYLRVIQNPADDIALERIINVPKRKIGEKTVDKIKVFAIENDLSLLTALRHIDDIKGMNKPTKAGVHALLDTLDRVNEYIDVTEKPSMYQVVNRLIRYSNFLDQYDPEKSEDEERIDNLAEFSKIALQFDVEHQEDEETEEFSLLSRFVAGTALFDVDGDSNVDGDVDNNRVRLTTVHSAKGLEWKVVFVVGLEEGIFPSEKSDTETKMEEERRGMYVAMTRAKDLLFLSYNLGRYSRNELIEKRPSRFLYEIPKQYVRRVDFKQEATTPALAVEQAKI